MANSPEPPAPSKLVSEPMTGATSDNQSDPYFAGIYSQIFPPYQDLAWERPNEISYSYQDPHLPNPYPMQMLAFPQPAPPRLPANAPRTSNFSSRTTLPPNYSNHFQSSRTAANNTFNISQTQDFESPARLIFELEHSIKILESMELSTIIIFLELINKKIGDIITSLQSSLLTTSLSKFEKKGIIGLSYKIWDICIELTKQYPTGYDSCINEFGFFAVILDELFKNSCITATKCVQADFACDNNQGLVSLDVHKPLIENTNGFLSSNLCEQDSSIPQISEGLIAKDDSFSDVGCLPVDQGTVVIQTTHEIVSLPEIEIAEEKVPFQSKVDTKAIFSCQASCENGDIDLNIKESLDMVFEGATILEIVLKGADEEKQTNKKVGKNAPASNSCEDVITNGSSYKPPWPPPLLSLDLEDKVVFKGKGV